MSVTYILTALRNLVYERAEGCCEYCLISEAVSFVKHQIDHIIAEKHGGQTVEENLALSCTICNKYKGSDIASLIPETNELIRFYNPRVDRWSKHFRLNGVVIEPLTDIGEATVRILQVNHDDQILERQVLRQRGRYPSQSALLLITEH